MVGNSQPININWEKQLAEYKVISQELFEEAKNNYSFISSLNDSNEIKNYFSNSDSVNYSISHEIDSFTSNSYLVLTEIINDSLLSERNDTVPFFVIRMVNTKSIKLEFFQNGNLNSILRMKNGLEVYGSYYNIEGIPFLIEKQIEIKDKSNFIKINYSNKRGRIFSVFSEIDSYSIIRDGLSIQFIRNKVSFVNYYDHGNLLYSLYNYQRCGGKFYETINDFEKGNKSRTYYYNKLGKVIGISFSDDTYEKSFISALSFKQGRIVSEKISDKRITDKDSGFIIYYDRKHNIERIEKY